MTSIRPLSRHAVPLLAAFAFFFCLASLRAGDADPNIERLRRRISEVTIGAAQGLISEQESAEEKADTALVIGAMFEVGQLEESDPMLAFEFYRQASEYGCAEADCALGNFYYAGLDTPQGRVPRDQEKAREYYQKAARHGSTAAMMRMGMIFADGMGVDPDPKKALPYFQDAASRGDEEALHRLEPVMRQAKEWQDAKPGRKANFPTSREEIIKPELARQAQNRGAKLDRLASHTYVELNKRIAIELKKEMSNVPGTGRR